MKKTVLLSALLSCFQIAPAQSLAEIANGNVRIVDLSYPLNSKNAYWPIGNYHPFQFRSIATLQRDGVFSGEYSTPEHLGTHLDAPNHFEAQRKSVDQIPLSDLVAPFVVIDISAEAARDADAQLTVGQVQQWEKSHATIPTGAVVLLHTGWGRFWFDSKKYQNMDSNQTLHFPGYSAGVAKFLVDGRQIKGIGIDNLSVDRGVSKTFEVHHIVNGAQKYHLENVANVDQLPPRGGFLVIAPIKIEGGSGGQARVWAVLPR
ncbi:MAG: cyclase family protein [Acidobacteria bacterium]|nr:cyclase family protein [Acidobacteriota bacterium]